MKQIIHFSGLNGLRAIAVIAVLFAHTTQGLMQFGLDSFVFGKYADGNPKSTLLAGFGVSIFFSLSGFLITYLLLAEKKETGYVNIKHFYMRRMLRIWPLYYLYFILCLLTMVIFEFSIETQPAFYYLLLLANIPFIIGNALPFLSHYWSLGVEEQFYSFWPWLVRAKENVLNWTIISCVGLIALKAIFRMIDIRFHNGEPGWLYMTVHITRFHCMMIGAIGAILYFQRNDLFLKVTNNLFVQLLSWSLILLAGINKFHIFSFIDNELVALITVFLIMGQIQAKYRIINLDVSFVDFIGKISYGVYVIHPLIIFYLSKVITFKGYHWSSYLVVYISVFTTTVMVAYLSYNFFEKRFLRLKEKYSTMSSDVKNC